MLDISVIPRSEVNFEEGIAGASSFYGSVEEANRAIKAEDGFLPFEMKKWWASANKFPAFIWYNFVEQSFCPAKVAFYPAAYSYGFIQMPKEFQFIGSNDKVCDASSTWSVLCENKKVASVLSFDETRGCEVAIGAGAPFPGLKFRCLGIKIIQATGITAVRGIQMWKWGFCWEVIDSVYFGDNLWWIRVLFRLFLPLLIQQLIHLKMLKSVASLSFSEISVLDATMVIGNK